MPCMIRHRAHRLTFTAAVACTALAVPASVGASDLALGESASTATDEAADETDVELTKDELAAIDALAEQDGMHGVYIMRMRSARSCQAAIRVVRNTYGWSAHCHGRDLWVIF